MVTQLKQVLSAIDAANACDPGRDDATGEPAALLYGRRMTAWLERIAPGAADELAIAARGQHIERWTIPRTSYPMSRGGYLRWRNDQKDMHARRLAGLMEEAGYDPVRTDRVKRIVRKEHFRIDPQAQTLEDVACLVFLEFYAPEFVAKHDKAKVIDIVTKTWAKMSPRGQTAAGQAILAPAVAEVVRKALAPGPVPSG